MKKIFFGLLIITLFLGGCVPTSLYYWGNYSNTLYHVRKEASDEARAKHLSELESIVTESNGRNLRVPPGVYCELGYMYAKKGNNKLALHFFELEKRTYPESTLLIDRLVNRVINFEGTSTTAVKPENKGLES